MTMRPLVTWTVKDAWTGRLLGTVQHRDIEYALTLARRRYGHNVSVGNLAWLRANRTGVSRPRPDDAVRMPE